MTGLVHDRVETVLLVGRVLDGSQGAVGVVHAVRSLHHVAVPVLLRGLVVTGVWVLNAVLVRVLGMGLSGARAQKIPFELFVFGFFVGFP